MMSKDEIINFFREDEFFVIRAMLKFCGRGDEPDEK